MIIDLHNHTIPLSQDSKLKPINLVEKISKLGIDGVCLTEHDAAWDATELQDIAASYGIVVIPGMEITTELGHVLVFGIDRYHPELASMKRLSEIADTEGAALVFAHPYRSSIYSNYWLRGNESYRSVSFDFDIHGVEVFNGRGSQAENEFSAHVAHALNIPGTGGSDAHHLVEIGQCVTQFKEDVMDLESLTASLRNGKMEGRLFSGNKAET